LINAQIDQSPFLVTFDPDTYPSGAAFCTAWKNQCNDFSTDWGFGTILQSSNTCTPGDAAGLNTDTSAQSTCIFTDYYPSGEGAPLQEGYWVAQEIGATIQGQSA